jgi:hypothetical protein
VAAGVVFGLTAAFTKASVDLFSVDPLSGLGRLAHSWIVYALVGSSILGMLVGQCAFRSGPLTASLPALTVTQRVVGTVLGAVVFGERSIVGFERFAVGAALLLIACSGIANLARPKKHPASNMVRA